MACQLLEAIGDTFTATAVDQALQIVRYRVELRVAQMLRASPFNENRAFACLVLPCVETVIRRQHRLRERSNEPRLAQASLSDDQHDLAHTLLRLLPPIS